MPIPAAVLAAGIATAGSVAGGLGKGPKRQYKYSKKLFDYQAAYNHPTKQMARLKEAGLNPNLVYGEGTKGATGQQTGMGEIDLSQGPDYGEAVQAGIGTYMQVKEANLRNEQQSIQNSLLGIEEQSKTRTQRSVDQATIETSEAKTQQARFDKQVKDMYMSQGGVGQSAEAMKMQMALVKQRYLNNQIDLYIKDESKASIIQNYANTALMSGAGATLREQEAIMKKAEAEMFKTLPRASVQPIIQVLRMLLNR